MHSPVLAVASLASFYIIGAILEQFKSNFLDMWFWLLSIPGILFDFFNFFNLPGFGAKSCQRQESHGVL